MSVSTGHGCNQRRNQSLSKNCSEQINDSAKVFFSRDVGGIKTKIIQLYDWLTHTDHDSIYQKETWSDQSIHDSAIVAGTDFSVLRSDRINGVATFIKNTLLHEKLSVEGSILSNYVSINIKSNRRRDLIITNMYVCPSGMDAFSDFKSDTSMDEEL